MLTTILFIVCIFAAVWSTILFVGNVIHRKLGEFGSLNVLIYAASITGIITHIIGIW